MSYLGSALPLSLAVGIQAIPLREKSGRLTDWGVQILTGNQNAAISYAEKQAGRRMTPSEKLEIIARVRKEFDLIGLRDKNGRLNDAGIKKMTEAQNFAISRSEALSGKKLSAQEKLKIIAKVQADYGINSKVAEIKMSPGLAEFAGAIETFIKEVAWRSTYGLPESVGTATNLLMEPVAAAANNVVEAAAKEAAQLSKPGITALLIGGAVLAMFFLRSK